MRKWDMEVWAISIFQHLYEFSHSNSIQQMQLFHLVTVLHTSSPCIVKQVEVAAMCVCMCVYYVCVCVCIMCVYVCVLFVCMCVCMCVYYVCVCVCMFMDACKVVFICTSCTAPCRGGASWLCLPTSQSYRRPQVSHSSFCLWWPTLSSKEWWPAACNLNLFLPTFFFLSLLCSLSSSLPSLLPTFSLPPAYPSLLLLLFLPPPSFFLPPPSLFLLPSLPSSPDG